MRSYSLLKRNEEEFEEPERAHGSVRSYSLLKRNEEEFEERKTRSVEAEYLPERGEEYVHI